MHSTLVRAQNVFGYFTTVVFAVSALIATSVLLLPQRPSASVAVRNVQVVRGRPHYYSPKKEEYAHIRFDLDADLSSLFNWNTKQVFVYVVARWPSSTSMSTNIEDRQTYSEAVIWDAIIPSTSLLKTNLIPSYVEGSKLEREKACDKKTKKKKEPKSSGSILTGTSSATFAAIPNPDDPASRPPGVLKMQNHKPKYQITDISGTIAERANVTLDVRFNVQPWVGALTWSRTAGVFSGDPEHGKRPAGGSSARGAAAKAGKRLGRWNPLPNAAVSDQFAFPALKKSKKQTTAGAGAGGTS